MLLEAFHEFFKLSGCTASYVARNSVRSWGLCWGAAGAQHDGRLVAGQPFRRAEAAGLHFPQAQKVAEPGLLRPGPALHLLGTGAFAQGREEEEEEEVTASWLRILKVQSRTWSEGPSLASLWGRGGGTLTCWSYFLENSSLGHEEKWILDLSVVLP